MPKYTKRFRVFLYCGGTGMCSVMVGEKDTLIAAQKLAKGLLDTASLPLGDKINIAIWDARGDWEDGKRWHEVIHIASDWRSR